MRSAFGRSGSLLGPAVLQLCLLAAAASPARAEGWPRIFISDPVVRVAVSSSLDGAVQWFAQTRCAAMLVSFQDEAGCPLSERLGALGTTFENYLSWVTMHDGSGKPQCSRGNVLAFTVPRVRVVYICGREFETVWRRDRDRARAVLIHEMLHTLGLGENGRFPTSLEITYRVLALCATRD